MEDQRTSHIWFPFLPRFPPKPPVNTTANASHPYCFAQEINSSAVPATTTHGSSPTPRSSSQQNSIKPRGQAIVDFILILILFILGAFATFLLFSVPLPSLVEIDSCYSSSALPPNVNNHKITSNLDVAFSVSMLKLPGGRSILYEQMTASVFHGKETLSNITLQPFVLHKNMMHSVVEAKFPNITIAFDEWSGRGGVSFVDIGLRGNVTYVQRGWRTVRDVMEVRCKSIEIIVYSATKESMDLKPVEDQSAEPTDCQSEITTAVDEECGRVLITLLCCVGIYVVTVLVYVKCTKTSKKKNSAPRNASSSRF